MTEYGLGLFPQHAAKLRSSAVDPTTAAARGYVSVDIKKRLTDLGFAAVQCSVPGLLIPGWNTAGVVVGHQYRPDDPRELTDDHGRVRAVKYENVPGSRVYLDVPPWSAPQLRSARAALVITEGPIKADALVSRGLVAVALLGVSAWRSGGMPLEDFRDIEWRDRRVIVAFDSDVMVKDQVQAELVGLTRYLTSKGARVEHVVFPEDTPGMKVGADDYFAAGHTAADFLALAQEPDLDPDPIPLDAHTALPPFPVEQLPGWVAEQVAGVARFTQTDPAMAGTSALGALSTAAGGRAVVTVRGGWREQTNLYVVGIADPAQRKSAVHDAMTRPLVLAEKELSQDEYRVNMRLEALTQREVAEQYASTAKNAAGKEKDATKRATLTAEAIDAAQHAETIVVPDPPQLVADDATPEALATLMLRNGDRIAVLSAEGGIFDMIGGRYSNGTPNLDLYLKGHAGDAKTVNRVGRPPEVIERPALTVSVMIQPGVLAEVATNTVLHRSGLLARFLYCLPRDMVGWREIGAPCVAESVAADYTGKLRRLAVTLAEFPELVELTFDEGARAVMLDYERDVEVRLRPTGDLGGGAREWGGKLVGATVRIAGLLHIADHPDAVGKDLLIPAETARRAIALGEFYTAHTLAAFTRMRQDPATEAARYLLGVLQRLGKPLVSVRDLHVAASRSRFPKAADLDEPIGLLEHHGYLSPLREAPTGRRGRPRSATYAVHPKALHPATQTTEHTETQRPGRVA